MSIRSRVRGSRAVTRVSQWRADRSVERGRRDILRRTADQVRSKTPVCRNRPNPVYAQHPHRRDVAVGRGVDKILAQERAARMAVAASRGQVAAQVRRAPDPFPAGSLPARYYSEREHQRALDGRPPR